MTFKLLPLLFTGFISVFTLAQIPEKIQKEIKARVDAGYNPSIAIALSDSAGDHYYVYGMQNLERNEKATVNTLYEIGSITKTFTGLLLARLTTKGMVALEDPIGKHLPDSLLPADSPAASITLKELATHRSSLPRLAPNMPEVREDDPYRNYDRKAMFTYLRTFKPNDKEKKFSYSNYGMALLGEVLAISQKTTYSALLEKEVLQPLQLERTFLQVPSQHAGILATPYTGKQKTSPWCFKAYAPAGALHSNTMDLLQYGNAMHTPKGNMKKPVALAIANHFTDGNGKEHGLGWFKEGDSIILHGGGTGGFRTFLMVDLKEKKTGVVLTNSGSTNAEDLLLHLIFGEEKPMTSMEIPGDIKNISLTDYAGTYRNDAMNMIYNVSVEHNQLHALLSGQPSFPIYYRKGEEFYYTVVDARIVFEKNDEGIIVGLTLHQNGMEIPFIKDEQ